MVVAQIDAYVDAWNAHDVERVAAFFAEDCIYEDAALEMINRGKVALSTFPGRFFNAYPNVAFTVPSVRAATECIV